MSVVFERHDRSRSRLNADVAEDAGWSSWRSAWPRYHLEPMDLASPRPTCATT